MSKSKRNGTEIIYSIKENNMGLAGVVLNYSHNIFKNVFCIVFISIVSILTLVSVKSALKKKKIILKDKNSKMLSKTEKTELRLTLMVVTNSLLLFISYGMSFVKWLNIDFISTNKCSVALNYILHWLPFSLVSFTSIDQGFQFWRLA